MTLRKEKLERYRRQLFAQREALALDLRNSAAQLIAEDNAVADTLDQASNDVERTITLLMKNRERAALTQIDDSLRRIDAGVYGTCERCEEDISEARIRAFPFTTLCIECKVELESEENRYSLRHA